jgi:DedD protein
MRGVFDDRPFQQAETSRDTELTLSSTILLLIFFGLVLLCGLCFGVGYSVGHRGVPDTATLVQPSSGESLPMPADSGRPKPSADPQAGAGVAQPAVAADDGAATAESSPAGATVQSAAMAAAAGTTNESQQVKPALENVTGLASGTVPPAAAVAPALAGAGTLAVQIAAISDQDDANVLMSALRKRGYAVAAHREPLDGLIHVRIGPFKTRDEADKWRDKLLNDGYNAVVQP